MSKPFLLIATLAFAIRLAWMLPARTEEGVFGVNMSLKHAEVARNLVKTGSFDMDRDYLAFLSNQSKKENAKPALIDLEDMPAPAQDKPEPYLGRMPGYPLILAATWKISGEKRFIYAQTLTAFLDSLAAALLFLAAFQIGGLWAGIFSGVLYALWPPLAILSGTAGHDALASFFNVAILFCLVKGIQTKRSFFFIGSGILLGLATAVRQDCLLLPVFLALPLALFIGLRKAALYTFAMLAIAIAINSPWGVRNAKLFDYPSFMPPTFWSGGVLLGIGDQKNPWEIPGTDEELMKWMKERGIHSPYNSPEFNNFAKTKAVAIIRENPVWFLKISMKRAVKALAPTFLYFYPGPQEFRQDAGGGAWAYIKAHPLAASAHFGLKIIALLLWPIAAFALIALPDKRKWILLALSIPAYYWATHIWMHMEYRYMLAGFWPLFLTAGLFLAEYRGKWALSPLFLFWKNK